MARQVTRAQGRSFAVGLAAVAVLSSILYIALTANQGRLPGSPTTTVRAMFADIGQLQVGSDVRQNGLFVGRVAGIEVSDDRALVTMELNGDVPVYRDAYAGIWDQSALAQKFVELRPGTPATGRRDAEPIPLEQTESTHDLADVLEVFTPEVRAAFASSLRALGGGLAGYGPGLGEFVEGAPGTLQSLDRVATTLAAQRTDLPALLRVTDRLVSRFAGREAQITSLLEQTEQTMGALGVDGGSPLAGTLRELPVALPAARDALDRAQPAIADIGVAMADLREGAAALGVATPDLRGVLREGVPPLETVPPVVDAAKPAVDELTDVLADARPFVPRLADGLASAAEPLAVLAPYASDIGTFAFDFGNLIENHVGWEHRLRIMIGAPAMSQLPGQVIGPDSANPYPAPGQAIRERDPDGGLIPGPGR